MRQDVGQLLWIGFDGVAASRELREALRAGRYGATVVFARNLVGGEPAGAGRAPVDLDAATALTEGLRAAAPDGTPALVAVDQEGGTVQRLREPATVWPPMIAHERLAPGEDRARARAVGEALGLELAALGFDLDFAPVLDVHTNPANPVIGGRAFGTTADAVTRRALAFAEGLAAAGVLSCGKHFPGHGDTHLDSHLALPRVEHELARLRELELAPFAAAAAAGVPMFMTAHVVFAALDESRPATMSPAVMTGLLREQLGYRGVIVSDDLDMKAIADHYGVADAAVQAIRAGCDALLLCRDRGHQEEVERGLIVAAERDSELRRQIGVAAERIRATKRAFFAARPARPARDVVGCAAHRRLAAELAG
ncbi:MAG: beta-N-acetylhexosaminidase [Kofleriaceae bacterium]